MERTPAVILYVLTCDQHSALGFYKQIPYGVFDSFQKAQDAVNAAGAHVALDEWELVDDTCWGHHEEVQLNERTLITAWWIDTCELNQFWD